MANTKISELAAASGVTADDLIPIVNNPGGTPATQKATAAQLLTYIQAAGAGIVEGRAKVGGVAQYSVPGVEWSSVSTKALTANRILYAPMFVPTTITLDQLVIEVATAAAAGKVARLAIYNADTDWQPTSRVVDAGTVAVDAGAVPAVVAASINTTLSPGRYLIAIISDGTPTLRSFRGGSRYIGLLAALGVSPIIYQLFVAGAGTTLPDPGTAWTTASGGGGNISFEHVVLCRVSTP